jgi:hypothetical protein
MSTLKKYAAYWRAALLLAAMACTLAVIMFVGIRLIVPQDEVIEVSGKVLDATGKPLHGVEVRWVGEGPLSVTHTDPEGYFSLPILGEAGIEALKGKMAFYHPDYVPMQRPYAGPELAAGEVAVSLDAKTKQLPPNPEFIRELSQTLQSLRAKNQQLRQVYWNQEAEAATPTDREKAQNEYTIRTEQLSQEIKYLKQDSLMYEMGIISWNEVEASLQDVRERWK